MSTTVVFGAAGQLGQCLARVAQERQTVGLVFLPEAEANILDLDALQRAFARYQPAYVINCAAYTAVDKAEDEPDLARRVNRDGVENLARLCAEHGAVLVQISTDFVFAGTGNQPLTETDPTEPQGVYGLTKLEGEQVIPPLLDHYFIFRTSWLYSEYAGNFLKTMLRLVESRPEISVVWDQTGTPTYAVDLAGAILQVIESRSQAFGLYHYSNEGVASWYDFATAIFSLSGVAVQTRPIRSAEYPTKATRPTFSVLDKSKAKKELGLTVPHWLASLSQCLARLGAA